MGELRKDYVASRLEKSTDINLSSRARTIFCKESIESENSQDGRDNGIKGQWYRKEWIMSRAKNN
jgi:hypothetical protein